MRKDGWPHGSTGNKYEQFHEKKRKPWAAKNWTPCWQACGKRQVFCRWEQNLLQAHRTKPTHEADPAITRLTSSCAIQSGAENGTVETVRTQPVPRWAVTGRAPLGVHVRVGGKQLLASSRQGQDLPWCGNAPYKQLPLWAASEDPAGQTC
jgi:hypothetical protein